MKNNLLNDLRNKIKKSLNFIEKIEDDIEGLSNEIASMIEYKVGRIIFVGAGISADMAKIIIDELWFNFQIPKGKFISITAGRSYADSLEKWKELEELPQTSAFELGEFNIGPDDLVIGLSSSGKTQYVISALEMAIREGSKTALITDTSNAQLIDKVDFTINTNFGEPIILGLNSADGSTTQKIILDSILYLSLEKSGRIYKKHLVYMIPVSKKIEGYCLKVISNLVKVDEDEAKKLLFENDGSLELTLISSLKKISTDEARELLSLKKGNFNKIF